MLDRRQSFRRRTLLAYRMSARKLGPIAEGTVHNLSETGARVSIPLDALVPHRFDVVLSDGAPRSARLVWYRDGTAGLALTPSTDDVAPISMRDAVPAGSLFEARVAAIAGRPTARRG